MEDQTTNIVDATWREIYTSVFEDFLLKEYTKREGAGQPRFYETPRDLALEAIEYFTYAKEHLEPLRITAFILHCKLNTRQGLLNYKSVSPDFKNIVERIQLLVEDFNVRELYTANQNGAKFVLQCGFNWVIEEKQVIENHTVRVGFGANKKEDEV